MSQTYIYVIKSKERDEFKVGISAEPVKRLASLQTARADELELLYTFPGTMETESVLHDLLAEFRIRGEWFTNYEKAKEIIFMYRPQLKASNNDAASQVLDDIYTYLDKENKTSNLFRLAALGFYYTGRAEFGGDATTPPSKEVLDMVEQAATWFKVIGNAAQQHSVEIQPATYEDGLPAK